MLLVQFSSVQLGVLFVQGLAFNLCIWGGEAAVGHIGAIVNESMNCLVVLVLWSQSVALNKRLEAQPARLKSLS